MELKSVVRTAWTLAAITPLQALVQQWHGPRALLLAALYAAGWIAIAIALRRDPDCERLRAFLGGRAAIALAVIAFVLLQLLLPFVPGHWIAMAFLAAGVWFLVVWACTSTTQSFSRQIAGHLTLAVVCTLLVASFEGLLRFAASRRPRNDLTATWGHPLRNNRLGFRERDFATPKPNGVFRVMVIGDSLTWGAGLSEPQRYTNLTESYLRGRRVEVLNFGLPGSTTAQERDVLRQFIAQVEPDLVVVGFCINDPQPRRQDYAVEVERYRFLFRLDYQLPAVGLVQTSAFLEPRLTGLLQRFGKIPDWPAALDRTYDPRSPQWQAFVQALADIKSICDQRHLPPPVFEPLLSGDGNYAKPDRLLSFMLKWSRQASAVARANGFQVVDLENDFKAEGYRTRSVNKWDPHPDARCQIVYARGLAAAIVKTLPRTTYR